MKFYKQKAPIIIRAKYLKKKIMELQSAF